MANTPSAMKRIRQTQKRNARNTSVKSAVKTAVKRARLAAAAGDKGKATSALRSATALIDTAASKGILHRKNASRRISRLAQLAARNAKA